MKQIKVKRRMKIMAEDRSDLLQGLRHNVHGVQFVSPRLKEIQAPEKQNRLNRQGPEERTRYNALKQPPKRNSHFARLCFPRLCLNCYAGLNCRPRLVPFRSGRFLLQASPILSRHHNR